MNIPSVQGILHTLGFEQLTPMQSRMGEAAVKPGGVILLSPTGSGKTLAYLLPLIRCLDTTSDSLQAVVVVPTRELAAQSEDVLRQMKTGVRVMSVYGGRPAMQEHRVMRELKPQVLFGTPGRLNDHFTKGNICSDEVCVLVLDEFDKCLELGFQDEISQTLSYLTKVKYLWLTSATDAEEIPAFVQRITPNSVRLDYLEASAHSDAKVTYHVTHSPQKDKLQTLSRLLSRVGETSTIVFVNHRESVERTFDYLRSLGFPAVAYHGGMEQEIRERALYKFRNGSASILVCTDLAARGLDIPEVGAIIHYHLPLKEEDFTHRNGRTARWDAGGTVFVLLGPEERLPQFVLSSIDDFFVDDVPVSPSAPRFVTLYIGRGKRDKLSKADILGFLCKKGGLKSADIGRIDVAQHAAYAAVRRTLVDTMLRRIAGEKIKGMKTLIEISKQ